MGGSGRATQLLARRLDIGVVDLPPPSTISDVRANLERVARALGHADRATPWVRRLTILERTAPRHGTDAMWISGGGISFTPDSLGTQWMRLAGLEQRALQGGRVTLETLLTRPPHVLVRSNYRSRQMSSGERWLDHPVVRRSRAKHVVTDGRPWTCLGPLMIPEIERLRRLVG